MSENNEVVESHDELLRLTVDIVSVCVSVNALPAGKVPEFIRRVYRSLQHVRKADEPAVPIYESVGADYLVCLEDGEKRKMLKGHLRAVHGMSPNEYRMKWDLPSSYPMVAPNYTTVRSELAKKSELGQNGKGDKSKGRRKKKGAKKR